jgi:hypothetical protein
MSLNMDGLLTIFDMGEYLVTFSMGSPWGDIVVVHFQNLSYIMYINHLLKFF